MSFVVVEIELFQKGKEFRCKSVTGLFSNPRDAVVSVLGESPLLEQVEADGWRGFRFQDSVYYIEEMYCAFEPVERAIPRFPDLKEDQS